MHVVQVESFVETGTIRFTRDDLAPCGLQPTLLVYQPAKLLFAGLAIFTIQLPSPLVPIPISLAYEGGPSFFFPFSWGIVCCLGVTQELQREVDGLRGKTCSRAADAPAVSSGRQAEGMSCDCHLKKK